MKPETLTMKKTEIENPRFKIAEARLTRNQPKLQKINPITSRNNSNTIIRKIVNKLVGRNKETANSKLKTADSQIRKSANKLMPNAYSTNHFSQNTLITFPQYLKKPIRFWTSNVGHEIRSNFDLELCEKVCEARGVESGMKMEY